jgi:hypothetical protein
MCTAMLKNGKYCQYKPNQKYCGHHKPKENKLFNYEHVTNSTLIKEIMKLKSSMQCLDTKLDIFIQKLVPALNVLYVLDSEWKAVILELQNLRNDIDYLSRFSSGTSSPVAKFNKRLSI